MTERIYLSPPTQTGSELSAIQRVLESNWIAPLGPEVDAFEQELAEAAGVTHAAALASGTAALHLALRLCGVETGQEVLCPTLTFAASAFPIRYLGAVPTFLDVDPSSWTLDVAQLGSVLESRARSNRLPAALVTVDLYGQCCDHDAVLDLCERYGVPVIEDAAEALGAEYQGRPAGGFGRFGIFSFNGNKIITTSGGGMLVSDDETAIVEARRLASQARDAAPHYEHSSIGYNYRLSNLLAAIGRVQLATLEERVTKRRQIFDWYSEFLDDLPGLEFMSEAPYGRSTRWLTCLTIDPTDFGATREEIRLALEAKNIESRPVWKPMHLQPVFADCPVVGGAVAEGLFERGLCLPSGTGMTRGQVERVSGIVRSVCARS